jgi:hypothetical protein
MTDPRIEAVRVATYQSERAAQMLLDIIDANDPVRVLLADTDKLTDLFLESGWNATRTARDSTWADADEWPREVWIALKAQQIEAHIVALRAAVDGEQS